mgnify:CR=1 FL=1
MIYLSCVLDTGADSSKHSPESTLCNFSSVCKVAAIVLGIKNGLPNQLLDDVQIMSFVKTPFYSAMETPILHELYKAESFAPLCCFMIRHLCEERVLYVLICPFNAPICPFNAPLALAVTRLTVTYVQTRPHLHQAVNYVNKFSSIIRLQYA